MVGHLFQNYDTIYVRFFATYTCVLSCFVGFLFPSIWPFSYKRAYICAQKKPIYMRYKQACVYGVTESRRIRGAECKKRLLHIRWSWKVTSVFIKHGRNGRVNFKQGLVLIHCPHSNGGCWLPDNWFVESVDCLLRDCVRYFTNADRNNDWFS